MECDKILQQVCDELAEDINSSFCESLKKHMEGCDDCRTHVGAMRNAVNLFKCLEQKQVPAEIHNRLVRMLNIEDIEK